MTYIKQNYKIYFVFLLLSINIILLFSSSTSPLFEIYYGDYYKNASSTALLMGKSWLHETIPYKDLYATGGPLFYFIQAIGWAFAQRTGVFIFQIINLSLFLFFMYKIANYFISPRKWWFILCLTIISIAATLNGGNSEEEFCLWLIAATIYMTIGFINTKTLSNWNCFLLGILTGSIIMIKFTAGGAVYGCIIFILLYTIYQRQTKKAFRYLSYMVIGMIIIIIPFYIYFLYNDAFFEMLQCTFVHNFKLLFADTNNITLSIHKCIKCLPIILLIFCGVINFLQKKKSIGGLMMSIGSGLLLFAILGKGYWHLYLPSVICLSLLVPIIDKFFTKKIKFFSIATCILCLIVCYSLPIKHYFNHITIEDFSGYKNLISDLKYYQKNSANKTIFLVDVPAFIYLEADIIPDYRYSMLQSEYNDIMPNIRTELNTYILNYCDAPIIITQSSGWMQESVGNYILRGCYYHGTKAIAVYEFLQIN